MLEAAAIYEGMMANMEKYAGINCPALVPVLQSLAAVYTGLGDSHAKQAEDCLLRVVNIRHAEADPSDTSLPQASPCSMLPCAPSPVPHTSVNP